ncbi:hypothetical protein [Streptomyces vietnamensis]|uniref:Uncharacterized protein n=1 Tax=Streptomyces vietnamensis TaxID=362257 RepID=A0A0B5I4N3_9ACTN|nr:hypothetical protein [Streptomyces vietnamensis]AJF63209.1 hypothetical protein SVTN_00270 [Streptomyces vietnamensis]
MIDDDEYSEQVTWLDIDKPGLWLSGSGEHTGAVRQESLQLRLTSSPEVAERLGAFGGDGEGDEVVVLVGAVRLRRHSGCCTYHAHGPGQSGCP